MEAERKGQRLQPRLDPLLLVKVAHGLAHDGHVNGAAPKVAFELFKAQPQILDSRPTAVVFRCASKGRTYTVPSVIVCFESLGIYVPLSIDSRVLRPSGLLKKPAKNSAFATSKRTTSCA